jgi:hypothetical protein
LCVLRLFAGYNVCQLELAYKKMCEFINKYRIFEVFRENDPASGDNPSLVIEEMHRCDGSAIILNNAYLTDELQ